MAISVVQRGTNTTTGFTGTVSKAFGSNNTIHNKLIVLVVSADGNNTSINTPSDTQSNTYNAVANDFDAGNFYSFKVFVVDDCKAGANTVTATNSSSSQIGVYIYEVSGLASTGSFDKIKVSKGDTGTSPNSGSITVTNNNELILGFAVTDASATETYTAGSGYSNLQQGTYVNGMQAAMEEQIISSGGSQAATFTLSGNNGSTMTALLSFSDTTVVNPTTRTQQGKARITATTTQAQTGKSRIQATTPYASLILNDSYSETYQNNITFVYNSDPGVAQTFTGRGGTLDSAKFYLKYEGSPTGNINAKIYAITGTFGTNSQPTGSALATSDSVNVTSLTTSLALVTFNFSGANRINIANGTHYALTLEGSPGTFGNMVDVGKGTALAYDGDQSFLSSGSWTTVTGAGLNFYVYTVPPQLQFGKARITATTTQTQLGKARVQITSTKTTAGKSRITAITTQTQLGKARITATTQQTQSGKARVQITSTQTVPGKARVTALTTRTQTGKSRVQVTTNVSGGLDQSQTTTNGGEPFGRTGDFILIGQTFTASITAPLQRINIGLSVNTNGAPTDAVQLQVYTDGGGQPGTLLGTSTNTIAPQNINTNGIYSFADFFFSGVNLTAGTVYWFVVSRTGASDSGNYYKVADYLLSRSGHTDPYPSGTGYYNDGTSWFTLSNGTFFDDVDFQEYYQSNPILGKANIRNNTLQTQTGKSRIQITTTQTTLGKARVTVITPRTQPGKARITAVTSQTQLGKASIKSTTTQTQTGKARIVFTDLKTQTGISRITVITSRLQTGLARITAMTLKTITGLARVTATTLRTQPGKARITVQTARTQLGKGDIARTTPQTQAGLSRITVSTTRTQPGKARVQITTAQTQLGKSRITITTQQTTQGKSRITVSTPRTQTGVSRITATTTRTQTGVARVTITTPRNQQGLARITVHTPRTQLGLSRITVTTLQTTVGKSRVQITTVKTQLGKSRVQVTTTQVQLGHARVQVTTLQTTSGKSRIQTTATHTISGLSRVTAIVQRNITGKGDVAKTTSRIQLGKGQVLQPRNQTITGKAGIVPPAPISATIKFMNTGNVTVQLYKFQIM